MKLGWKRIYPCGLVMAFSLLAGFSGAPARAADTLPPQNPNRELFENKCQKCHSLERVKEAHLTRETAKATVERMKNKPGADITPSDAEKIYDYLGNYFVIPPSPPVAPAPMR